MGTYAKHVLSTCQRMIKNVKKVGKNSKTAWRQNFLLVGVHTITWQNERWEVGELKVTQCSRWRWVEDIQQIYGVAREGYQCETFPVTSGTGYTPGSVSSPVENNHSQNC